MNNVKISTEKLKKYFYNRFKNNDYESTLLSLYNVDERERIINELAESQDEAYYYNNIYEKTLKNISIIFKNNNEYIKAKQLQEDKEKELAENQKEIKEEKRIKLYKKLITIFFIFINPITIIIYLLIWGYFAFALPVLNG